MNENKIELKSISELLGMSFYIPSYQRGYRWTEQQVNDLLNDIWEFSAKINNESSEFYCLQPLVVKNRDKDILDKIKKEAKTIEEVEKLLKGSWEVIDGQQRLTTIFIILSVLESDKYSLEYETRLDSKKYLDNICEDIKHEDNIDYHHISQAKATFSEWLNSGKINKDRFKEILLNNVKYIWYESINEDPIQVFTRLNIGKIPLTNAELIKALLLNSSNFTETNISQLRLRQQEIASEWDKIEYTLQNDEFWLFIHKLVYDKPTRIDFIFDLIVSKNPLNVSSQKIGADKYRTFRYFYEYFSYNKNEKGVENCWNEVKKYFQIFQEWFNDLEMYHYVGYLVEEGKNLESICNLWENDKKSFLDNLKTEIKKKIKNHTDLSEIYDIEYVDNKGENKKGVAKTTCKSLLLLHNIQTVINQTNINQKEYQQYVFYKFPFHLYKIEGWDVEHIDSNIENDLSEKDQQNEFLLNIYHSVDIKTQENIQTFINNPNATNWTDFEKYTKKSNDSLSQEEKNQIWNFTLLDSTTNRSYGNSIFSAKRRIIIGKDRGDLLPIPKNTSNPQMFIGKIKKAKSSFIPPCTKQVFLKYYTPVNTDYNYWTKSDAEAYRKNIFDTLKEFGVTLNEQNNE